MSIYKMYTTTKKQTHIPLRLMTVTELKTWRQSTTSFNQKWLENNKFNAKKEQICLLPDHSGNIKSVLIGVNEKTDVLWSLAHLPKKLPVAHYCLDVDWTIEDKTLASIGWGLACYAFDQFKNKKTKPQPTLYIAQQKTRIQAFVKAIFLVRDLINMPANEMMPQHLAQAMQKVATPFNATFNQIVGDDLLKQNYPCIHAVGRASDHAPRLLELNWEAADSGANYHLTLVGKGVCFDTGGLDLKPSKYMRTMKKDMGGAAHVLGLAHLIMAMQLPVKLRVLIPAADNAISGDAFRPGDILATRAGKTIEVDNTDAEGRLVLCDALTEAVSQKPDLILDFATLTGAARVALGTEVPVYFANHKKLSQQLNQASETTKELIWQLPLHKPYLKQLDSTTADLLNCSPEGYGGAITAALFLNEFIPENINWVHFDVMAWNNRDRNGRPTGGEAMGLFAVFDYLEQSKRQKI